MLEWIQERVILIYFVLWATSCLVFHILDKKTKDIKKKRKLSLYSGVSIFALMLGVIVIWGLPTIIITIFIAIAVGMLYLSNKYTFYCQACGHCVQQPFSKIEFCPKCGAKIES